MPKNRRYEQIIFEEPLIDISMQPTEEVDPLFIDPTAESLTNDIEDDLTLNGFSIFSPKTNINKQKQKESTSTEIDGVKIKEEKEDEEVVKVKEEPKDPDEEPEEEKEIQEEEIDPVEALAQALDKVEFLCPKCTFRSTDKDQVTQHFVSSHRVCQIGIPRPCDKCDFIAKTVRELAAHKKQSHPRAAIVDNLPTLPTGEFKCPHCDFTSFHRNNVRSHTRVHTKDTVYTCDKCPYTAISRINIENHAARHLVKSRRKWKFKCKHCGLLERTEKLLQRHLILHGEGEMLKCQLCSYKSPYNHIISMHTRICHGIVGKKSWDREEKWKRRVRQSTRTCARERKTYTEEKNDDIEKDNFKEEFFELPVKKSGRGRKKRVVCDNNVKKEETVEENTKQEPTDNAKPDKKEENVADSGEKANTEQVETPRRPTLEERLGRARELINRNLSKKKRKTSPAKEDEEEVKKDSDSDNKTETKSSDLGVTNEDNRNHSGSDEENITDEDFDNQSHFDEEETGSKEDDWSEEESEFDPETADESMQSFVSEKGANNSTITFKDNENSLTADSDTLNRTENSNTEKKKSDAQISNVNNDNSTPKNNKRTCESLSRSDSEQVSSDSESSKSKRFKPGSPNSKDSNLKNDQVENVIEANDNSDNVNNFKNDKESFNEDENLKESACAVLVLKRNGSSFTCIPKNTDSP